MTPYVPEFVAAFKEIPSRYRSYDPGARTWTVKAGYTERAIELLHDYFDDVEYLEVAGSATPPPSSHPLSVCLENVRRSYGDFATLHLLPDAPRGVIEGMRRTLAQVYHPDRVGYESTAKMQRINAAVDRLLERVR